MISKHIGKDLRRTHQIPRVHMECLLFNNNIEFFGIIPGDGMHNIMPPMAAAAETSAVPLDECVQTDHEWFKSVITKS